ncbi:MAG: S9 family peptidase [Chlorobi bacterium]|nr:S9 family peptidase [Chlorobiota bacterium]
MKSATFLFSVAFFLLISACSQQNRVDIQYPRAKKVDTTDVYFGHKVADPYRWLEDDNSKETKEWVKAENKITQEYLSKIPFREEFRERLTEIWNYPKYGVPFKRGGKYFFFKNDGIQNQSVLYMQKTPDSEPEVLLDPNKLSEDGTVALAGLGVSKDGKYLGYSIASGGSDWNEIYVMQIKDRKRLNDHIRWVKFSGISWKGDGFFYSAYGKPEKGDELSGQNRFHKVFYHKLGTNQKEDKLIFQDKEHPLRNFYAYLTKDKAFVMITESESTSGNALYAARADDVGRLKFKKIAEGFDYDYQVIDHIGEKLLIQTNDNAPKGRLILVDFKNPDPATWETLIEEKEDVLEDAKIVGGRLFIQYLKDASSRAYFYDLKGHYQNELILPAIGTLRGFNGDKDDNIAFYGFTSFTFPSTIYRYNIESGESTVFKSSEVDFNPEDYETEQVFYESKDGTIVPMFIVYKRGMKKDGKNPTLLYGYGGFNISLTPSFSVSRVIFLEQGGIYAMANLRGGGEYGEEWHEAGTKMNKQNVFDDFIYAAKWLINNQYTSRDKLAIIGGSNGGLLVGACMTQQPDLFKVAIPIVGVMDMLRYQNFTIGWAWASDYGTSADSEEMFKYLYSYSPLHNIKEGVNYPATLAITADHDDRVVPAHTFKFMATLQEKNGGKNPVLVRIETRAGHGAGKPTAKQIEETTDIYSFIMYNLGMKPVFEK